LNLDLPQFEAGLEGWSEVNLGYDLAGLAFIVPVAIQVFTGTHRVLATGIITSTEDQFAPDSTDNTEPNHTVIYFRDADPLRIEWSKTKAVLAMVAVATGEEEEHGEDS
jgi:hypothetical protein